MIEPRRRRLFAALAVLVVIDALIAIGVVIAISYHDDTEPKTRGVLPAFVDHAKRHLRPAFEGAAHESRVPVALLEALAWRESRWRAEALNPDSGAIGIGQLLPATATFVANELLHDPTLDPAVAADNIRMTARYLRAQLEQFEGDERLALAAYLQGSTSVRNDGVSATTQAYLKSIAEIRERFEAAGRGKPGNAVDPLNQ